jgi:hypothetical protein
MIGLARRSTHPTRWARPPSAIDARSVEYACWDRRSGAGFRSASFRDEKFEPLSQWMLISKIVNRDRGTVSGKRARICWHYRYIIDKTGNNPEKLVHTLDDDPQISVALRKLGEIRRAVNQYWKAAQRRYIEQAHPDFGDALRDFDERWAPAYNECRDRIYGRVLAQISREFIRNYRILVARTANSPAAVAQLEKTDSELGAAIEELRRMLDALDDRQRKFEWPLAQGPNEFPEVLADVKDRWTPTFWERVIL